MKKKIGLVFCGVVTVLVFCGGLRAQVLSVTNGGTLSLSAGATLSLNGGILLENGAVLTNKGRITVGSNGTGNGAGSDWTDKGTIPYGYGTGAVLFNSIASQTIQSIDTFQRIEVDNAGTKLAGDVRSKQWYLINGVVEAGASNVIVTTAADTGIVADKNNQGFTRSWIMGNLRRYLDFQSVDQYTFPVGPGGNANQVVMDNLKTAPLAGVKFIDVQFGAKPGNDAGLVVTEDGMPYTMVNTGGVWTVTPDAEPISGTYDLLLYFDGFAGLADNAFGILRRPDGSSDATEWAIPSGGTLPAAGSPGRTVASGYARRNGIKAFSQFGIGMIEGGLPVVLTDFEVRRADPATAALSWTTQMESNNKGFGVERRTDADTVFASRAFVPSVAFNGNSSSALSYRYSDTNGYSGVSYYRLRQVDLDGRSTYSMIKAISGRGGASVAVLLFPNPNRGQFHLRLEGIPESKMARIVDQRGALVRVMRVTVGNDWVVGGLTAGVYVVQVVDAFGPGKTFSEKVMVLR